MMMGVGKGIFCFKFSIWVWNLVVRFGNECFKRTTLIDFFSNGGCGGGATSWVGFETVVRAD